ncbi:triose-phosphate isomerase [Sutcliffiella horikoshii]|uniref:triose-phosphate isomerase n=1 Tax=Sutcliffiella horikoshii TaxID=79883 RepID=UPI001CBD751D|nr:triose-phosphate isomerase [Sutcliffiella horikoshii]UAL48026.1 triose-phosphate isomerase [Sutcliffiella horikoshii]
MNKIYVGTNWKMTKTITEGITYTKELKKVAEELTSNIELFIIPSYTALVDIKKEIADSGIKLGAQNMHWEEKGAYTGEISPRMLQEIGIDLVELGHSERRQYYNEKDTDINKKVISALRFGMKPLVCIGEDNEQKNNGNSVEVLVAQLKVCLRGVPEEDIKKVLVAYEPVWAIGEKGIPAEAEYVGEIHTILRNTLVEMFPGSGHEIPLLYGGSVNLNNFQKYMNQRDVNGLFVGRTAWDMKTFEVLLHELDKCLYN